MIWLIETRLALFKWPIIGPIHRKRGPTDRLLFIIHTNFEKAIDT